MIADLEGEYEGFSGTSDRHTTAKAPSGQGPIYVEKQSRACALWI